MDSDQSEVLSLSEDPLTTPPFTSEPTDGVQYHDVSVNTMSPSNQIRFSPAQRDLPEDLSPFHRDQLQVPDRYQTSPRHSISSNMSERSERSEKSPKSRKSGIWTLPPTDDMMNHFLRHPRTPTPVTAQQRITKAVGKYRDLLYHI